MELTESSTSQDKLCLGRSIRSTLRRDKALTQEGVALPFKVGDVKSGKRLSIQGQGSNPNKIKHQLTDC